MTAAPRPYRSSLRDEQARATRRRIVDAGAQLFVELGYAATTIDAIAERAGVSRRTVALASMWESLVVLGAAAVAGLVAGFAAQVVLLRSLALGVVDDAATPRVVPDADETRVVLLAGSVVLVLVLVLPC